MTERNLVELPSEAELGPAMRALPNDRWRRFVTAICQVETATGQINYTQAAQDAGYNSVNRNSLGVIGHNLAHDDRIQAAIVEEGKRRIKASLGLATAAVIKVLTNPLSKPSEVMKAATILMDRGGMPMSTEHNVNVAKVKDQAEQISDVIALCKELGMDPATVLGNIGYKLPERIANVPVGVQHAGLPGDTSDKLRELANVIEDVEFSDVTDPWLKDFL